MTRRKHSLSVLILVLSISASMQAGAQRLQLAITDPIGNTSGSQCALMPAALAVAMERLPAARLLLTEKDVADWNPVNALWTISRQRTSDALQMADHCFVLAIDGVPVTSGMVLAVHTARLVRVPMLNIIVKHGAARPEVDLQLTSGNEGSLKRPIYRDALDAILSGEDGQPRAGN